MDHSQPRIAALLVSRGAPVSGEDTVSILQELGYGEDEIQQLLKTGIAVAGS